MAYAGSLKNGGQSGSSGTFALAAFHMLATPRFMRSRRNGFVVRARLRRSRGSRWCSIYKPLEQMSVPKAQVIDEFVLRTIIAILLLVVVEDDFAFRSVNVSAYEAFIAFPDDVRLASPAS